MNKKEKVQRKCPKHGLTIFIKRKKRQNNKKINCLNCNTQVENVKKKYCSIKCVYLSGARDIKMKSFDKKEPIIYEIINKYIENNYNNSETGRFFNVSDVSIYSKIKKLSELNYKYDKKYNTDILKDYIIYNFNRKIILNKYNIDEEFYLFVILAKAIREIINKKTKKYYYLKVLQKM